MNRSDPLLDVRDLIVRYGTVIAVDQVSFTVDAGETLALNGPSGCGKSSTVAAVLQLRRPGHVAKEALDLSHIGEGEVYLFEIRAERFHRSTHCRLEIARGTTARDDHEGPFRLDSDMRCPLRPLRE